MDNSDSSQDYLNSSQNSTLPLQSDIVNENRDRLSNTVFFMNLSNSQNATNSHPLMSPTSPVSPDYPDLIPEKPKAKSTHDRQNFNPKAHSTPTPVSLEDEDDSFVRKLNEPLSEYDDTLSGEVAHLMPLNLFCLFVYG